MAISPEQQAQYDKDWHQQPLCLLQSNWSLPAIPQKEVKQRPINDLCSRKQIDATENTLFLAVTDTATIFSSANLFDTVKFIEENPETRLLVYEAKTEEERAHMRNMRREQGYDYYES